MDDITYLQLTFKTYNTQDLDLEQSLSGISIEKETYVETLLLDINEIRYFRFGEETVIGIHPAVLSANLEEVVVLENEEEILEKLSKINKIKIV